MFNLSRMLGFLSRALRYLVLISIPILTLAMAAEVVTQRSERWGTSIFWLEVFINTVPFIFVIGVVYWLAGRFIRDVYQLKGIKQGIGFLIRCQLGRISFGPWLVLSKAKVKLDINGLVRRLGGPGGLVIYNDTAVVLERGGRLTRVEGPGFPGLEPFEAIYDIIDLRPKHRNYTVQALTKEGIPVSLDIKVQYKIADDNQPPTESIPYPFSKEAIFKAATGKWRREQDRVQDMDWEGWLIISQAEARLRSILARYFLDELISLTASDRLATCEAIQDELEQELVRVAPDMGAKLLQVKLDTLKVDDEITQQWIEDWQERWQQWSEDKLALEKAKNIQMHKPLMALADQTPIAALSQELQKLDPNQANSIMLLRLFDSISQMQIDGDSFYFLPDEAVNMLERIRHFLTSQDDPGYHTQPGTPASTQDLEHSSGSPRKSHKSFKSKIIPITGQVAAGREKSFLTTQPLGYIAQVAENEFVVKGNEEEPLHAQVLKGMQLKFNDAYKYFAVRVSGNSMDQAGIASGDYVILQKPKHVPVRPDSGDIVAAVFHDEDDKVTLKRICFGPRVKGIILRPESSNPVHRSKTISKKDFVGNNPRVEVAAIAVAVLKLYLN